MILDLKGKLEHIMPDAFPNLFHDPVVLVTKAPELDDAILALKALGYSDREVQKVTKTLESETLTTEQYIKKALQMMLR